MSNYHGDCDLESSQLRQKWGFPVAGPNRISCHNLMDVAVVQQQPEPRSLVDVLSVQTVGQTICRLLQSKEQAALRRVCSAIRSQVLLGLGVPQHSSHLVLPQHSCPVDLPCNCRSIIMSIISDCSQNHQIMYN